MGWSNIHKELECIVFWAGALKQRCININILNISCFKKLFFCYISNAFFLMRSPSGLDVHCFLCPSCNNMAAENSDVRNPQLVENDVFYHMNCVTNPRPTRIYKGKKDIDGWQRFFFSLFKRVHSKKNCHVPYLFWCCNLGGAMLWTPIWSARSLLCSPVCLYCFISFSFICYKLLLLFFI